VERGLLNPLMETDTVTGYRHEGEATPRLPKTDRKTGRYLSA